MKIDALEKDKHKLSEQKDEVEDKNKDSYSRWAKEKAELERRTKAEKEEYKRWCDGQMTELKQRLQHTDDTRKKLQNELLDVTRSLNEAQSQLYQKQDELQSVNLRVQDLQSTCDKLRKDDMHLKEKLGDLKFDNLNLNEAIENYK